MLVIAFAAQYLPWMLVPRGTYIYHYFPSVPFIILCTGLIFEYLEGWLTERAERRALEKGKTEEEAARAEKLVGREIERLTISFEAAKADGFRKYIMFLHYPPTNILQTNSAFTRLAEKYGASQVIYGHCHGEKRFNDSIRGMKRRIRYSLVSGDCLRWHPMKVL